MKKWQEKLQEFDYMWLVRDLGSIGYDSNRAKQLEKIILQVKISLVDEIKAKMYTMPALKEIEVVDGDKSERLEVLTKYQIASLLNVWPHTYLDGTSPMEEKA